MIRCSVVKHISPAQLVSEITSDLDDIEDKVDSIVQSSAKHGRDLVKEFISTRPSQKSGKRGRIDTGDMLKGATYSKLGKGSARFGMKNGPHYSVYQEHGFTHNRSGEWVEGMFAVADAFEIVGKDIEQGLRSLK